MRSFFEWGKFQEILQSLYVHEKSTETFVSSGISRDVCVISLIPLMGLANSMFSMIISFVVSLLTGIIYVVPLF